MANDGIGGGFSYDHAALDRTERLFWREIWESAAPDVELLAGNRADNVGQTSSTAPTRATWKQVKPRIPVPQGPSPAKLVVNNLKKGSGAMLEKGDEATVRYID